MATVGNNTSAKYEHLRKAFFTDGEKKYFENVIMNDPAERVIHAKLLRYSADDLYAMAVKWIEMVERGEVSENEIAEVEYLIAHCLGAIEDLHPELILEDVLER